MAAGKNARSLTIEQALRTIQDRIRRLENSPSKRIGQWTITQAPTGELVATKDGGTPQVIAS